MQKNALCNDAKRGFRVVRFLAPQKRFDSESQLARETALLFVPFADYFRSIATSRPSRFAKASPHASGIAG